MTGRITIVRPDGTPGIMFFWRSQYHRALMKVALRSAGVILFTEEVFS